MSVSNILKKIFGSKSDRDMKQVKPTLDKVLAAFGEIDRLSNDDLRARTQELRAKVLAVEAPFGLRMEVSKAQLEEGIAVNE